MLIPDIRIETERLILRPPQADDFNAYAENMADVEASRYIGGQQPRELAWRGFLTLAGAWAIQGFAMFSVIEKESGRWIGRLGPWHPVGWPGTEIGWGLAREAWGKGYAYEGCVVAIDWAFERLGWTDMIHSIDSDNVASLALAKRLGSTLQRKMAMPPPYEGRVAEIWGQTREQWQRRK